MEEKTNYLKLSKVNMDDLDNEMKKNGLVNRISSLYGRVTTTSTVYEISYESGKEEEVVDFFTQNKNSLNIKDVYQEKQLKKDNEENAEAENEEISSNNINLEEKIFLIVDQDDASNFKQKFDDWVKKENLKLALKETKAMVRSTSDVDKKNKKVELTKAEKKILNMIVGKKEWILNRMSAREQVEFIDKLIKLADEEYKNEREKHLGNNGRKPDEYRYLLNLIFKTNYLTYDALVNLANFLCKREISLEDDAADLHLEIKSIWNSIYTELNERDISGKRDRMKVMISPEYRAANISAHIKLAEYLRENGFLNKPEDKKAFYNHVIAVAEREYSKLHAEFWLKFLLYVVGLSFLITLAGVIVTALLGLVGFSQLAACAVLLVSTLISTGFKFRADYQIFPWDWVYWWKDAKANCLIYLKSEYMKGVLCDGNTEKTIDKELPTDQGEAPVANVLQDKSKVTSKSNINTNNDLGNKNNNAEKKQERICQNLKLNEDKKTCKDARKRYGFLFCFSSAVFIAAALTFLFPSVVAKAISLILTVFKLELTFTIPAIISSAFLCVGIVALVAAVIFFIKYKNNRDAYQQKKFDLYQKYLSPRGGKYFMKIKGNHKYYTENELTANKLAAKVKKGPGIS